MKTKKYEGVAIRLKSLDGSEPVHFNVMDTETGEKVCTCYKQENVDVVLMALNREVNNESN